jgi:hypothetical protein
MPSCCASGVIMYSASCLASSVRFEPAIRKMFVASARVWALFGPAGGATTL